MAPPPKCGNQKTIASLNLFGRIQITLHSYKPLALDFSFVVGLGFKVLGFSLGLYQNNGQSAI
jgi:hypothetical protein